MPYFRRDGHEKVTSQTFLDLLGDHLPQAEFAELPVLTGEALCEAALAEKIHCWGEMAGHGMRLERSL